MLHFSLQTAVSDVDDTQVLVDLLALCLTIFAVCTLVPQVFRCYRVRTTAGISALSQFVGLITAVAWLGYGVMMNDWTQITVNSVDVVMTMAVLIALHKFGELGARQLGCIFSAAAVTAAIFLASGLEFTTLVASMAVSVWRLPQVRLSWLNPIARGLSTASLSLSIANDLMWLTYGLVAHQPAVS